MSEDPILKHWNQRAVLAEKSGSDDVIAKEIEANAISNHIRDGMVVAEFGCGNAATAINLRSRHDIELHCFDFSPAMIELARERVEQAGMTEHIHLEVCDIRTEPKHALDFDAIYTERMIINLPDWETQANAIRYLVGNLKSGGTYLMCENSRNGLDELNALRSSVGLESIAPPWHNLYLIDELVSSLELPGAKCVDVELFSATYYFLSRVINASLAASEGKSPSYDAPVNSLALRLPSIGKCAQGKLWIFQKTHV